MFQWRRALRHALIPVAFAVGVALLFLVKPADDQRFGEGVGRFAVFMAIAGVGISYLVQTGRRRAALGATIGLVGLVGVLVGVLLLTSHPAVGLTAADRGALLEVVDGSQHRLRHPTLGFSILRPPASYVSAPKLAQTLEKGQDPGSVAYVYADDPPTSFVAVSVFGDVDTSRAGLRRMLDGIRRGLEKSTMGLHLEVAADEITGDDAHAIAHLHVAGNGLHFQLLGYPLQFVGRPAVLVTVMTMTPDVTQLADVLNSFRS